MSRNIRPLPPSSRRGKWVALRAMLAACIAVAIPARAHIHHSQDGTSVSWYPLDCCHDGDCHPVAQIKPLVDGFVMTTEDGATLFVPLRKPRRQSLDGRWHVCFDPSEKPAILCIFEPRSQDSSAVRSRAGISR
jgi:hypothetical protein